MERIGGPSPLAVPLPVTEAVARVFERHEEKERERAERESKKEPAEDQEGIPEEPSLGPRDDGEEEAGRHVDARV